ncbi:MULTISPECIES: ankyrin repeat domain-containing protein [unclassified Janthinobacterium]|uniref:ankyrin repeat domain-containing protein n=1 Tax=unclassified Janthinobacterium TaxID=2610881 RepID=UPI00034664D3|nr:MULTISPECIES: ankyrin repeat domain-containing protein [unclassified Janthinobacterium]MEC5160835.1 ankyrin repeat protein [Janthinobacterium sp. CG_S6]
MLKLFSLRRRAGAFALAAALGAGVCAPAAADDAYDFSRSAQIDDARTMGKLLAAGVDPNLAEPQRGDPGMVLALREGSNKVFNLLLAQPRINLEARSGNGDTALMMAAYKRNMPAVMALLAKGANVNQTGWTALHYAASIGDDAIVRVLLERHAYIDAESPAKITPLMVAARDGKDYTVKLLLDEGADATLKSAHGWTAVQFAMATDKVYVADIINAHLKAKAGK